MILPIKASLIVYVYTLTHALHLMPKVSTQVYMLDRKIWKLFRPCGNGRKRTKCDQFFCPTSDFFDFCNPCFFYHTFTNDVDFVEVIKRGSLLLRSEVIKRGSLLLISCGISARKICSFSSFFIPIFTA